MHTNRLSKLIKELSHSDSSKRRQAAEELSAADERGIYPLILALQDSNTGVQDAAMRALISIGGETTAYMVLPLLREDSLLRNTAMIILREIGSKAVSLLYPLLKDRDENLRKFSIDLMADIREGVSPEKILPLMHDANANVRGSAAEAIGVLGYMKALPDLTAALKDEEWVCFSALSALAQLKDGESIGPIAELLDGESETLRCAAIETLGKIGSERSGLALAGHLSKSEGFEKVSTVKSLLQTGITPRAPGVAEILLEMFINGDWEEKLISLKGIVDLKECAPMATIMDICGSLDPSEPPDEELLCRIKDTLMGLGCEDAFIAILDNQQVRFRAKVIAIDLLGELRCKEAVPALITLLDGDLKDVRRASIRAISNIEDEGATAALLGAVEDFDSHVRKAAIMALGKIGEGAAFDPIMEMLQSENYKDVIEAAVRALLAIDAKSFLARMPEFGTAVQDVAEGCCQEFL